MRHCWPDHCFVYLPFSFAGILLSRSSPLHFFPCLQLAPIHFVISVSLPTSSSIIVPTYFKLVTLSSSSPVMYTHDILSPSSPLLIALLNSETVLERRQDSELPKIAKATTHCAAKIYLRVNVQIPRLINWPIHETRSTLSECTFFSSRWHCRHVVFVSRQTYQMDCYFRQSWEDRRLAFGRSTNTLPVNVNILQRIWKPDTHFFNGLKSHIHVITSPNKLLRISNNGRVLYSMR